MKVKERKLRMRKTENGTSYYYVVNGKEFTLDFNFFQGVHFMSDTAEYFGDDAIDTFEYVTQIEFQRLPSYARTAE